MTDNRVFLNSEITFPLKQFLVQYSCIHGLPSPLRHRNDSNTFIYLPTDRTYTSVYKEYKDYYYTEHDESNQIISYYTFRRLWIEMMPYLKFQAPASNLCEISKLEHQHYNDNIEKSKNDLTIAHVCYDWAQNVFISYSPQQVGSIYFKSASSVHLFGVCKTEGGQNHQLNFVIGENELPKGTSKSANTTINMLVMLNWYEDITVNFMIPGHTKFICDSFFGHIKKVYWKHKVNTINDVKNIINNSSNGNEAILYDNGINWNYSEDIGKIYVSKESGGVESCYKLLKSDNFNKNSKPDLITTVSLTEERQNYLYSKI
ncbi:unnamed protein product [Rhizophagus irregularis]|nr:unnamed protein product [Rhizophagus irregularis]